MLTYINYNILRYSLEPKISLAELKNHLFQEQVDTTKLFAWMQKNQVKGIMEGEANYSHHRFKIPSRPYIIYYQGNLDLLYKQKLGVVGSRKATSYGKQIMQDLFEQLEGKDVVTISGGAEGIDELCHNLSIEKDIPTICVLGGGIAYYLSHARRGLFERIVSNGGLILSEFRLKEQPAPYTFPQRNRIIAGLSDWLIVPCATEESGSLITVDYAKKVGVHVYGVPGSVYEHGQQGVNKAIATGDIKAIYDIKIFVESLGLMTKSASKEETKKLELTDEQQLIYSYLQAGEYGLINAMSSALGKDALSISMILTELEMEGLVYETRPGEWKAKFA